MKTLLDYDDFTGVTTYFHEDGNQITIESVEDVEPVLEMNKAQQNHGFNKKSEMWHAATIPPTIQMDWLVKHGVNLMDKDHWPAVKRLLNSNEYSYLRRNNFTL